MTGIGNGPKIVFEIGSLRFTETVVMGWVIIGGADTVLVAHTRFEKSA